MSLMKSRIALYVLREMSEICESSFGSFDGLVCCRNQLVTMRLLLRCLYDMEAVHDSARYFPASSADCDYDNSKIRKVRRASKTLPLTHSHSPSLLHKFSYLILQHNSRLPRLYISQKLFQVSKIDQPRPHHSPAAGPFSTSINVPTQPPNQITRPPHLGPATPEQAFPS